MSVHDFFCFRIRYIQSTEWLPWTVPLFSLLLKMIFASCSRLPRLSFIIPLNSYHVNRYCRNNFPFFLRYHGKIEFCLNLNAGISLLHNDMVINFQKVFRIYWHLNKYVEYSIISRKPVPCGTFLMYPNCIWLFITHYEEIL